MENWKSIQSWQNMMEQQLGRGKMGGKKEYQ